MLGPDNVRDIFDYCDGQLIWKQKVADKVRVGAVAGAVRCGRRSVSVHNDRYLCSRVVWLWHHLAWPNGQIDHIDRDQLNNRIENLRDVSCSVNLLNRRVKSRLGFEGVSETQYGFVAKIQLRTNQEYLGFFQSPEEAHKAFSEAHVRVHGVNSRYHPEHPNYEPLAY